MKVIDVSGVIYKLIEQKRGKVRLQNQRYPEISHNYKKSFIDSAIEGGLLTPVAGEFVQQKMKME